MSLILNFPDLGLTQGLPCSPEAAGRRHSPSPSCRCRVQWGSPTGEGVLAAVSHILPVPVPHCPPASSTSSHASLPSRVHVALNFERRFPGSERKITSPSLEEPWKAPAPAAAPGAGGSGFPPSSSRHSHWLFLPESLRAVKKGQRDLGL